VTVDPSHGIALESTGRGVDRIVGKLMATVYTATEIGIWNRLKTCGQCEWVFFDRSRNRSARWCAMAVCGNRTKNREYRQRRGTGGRTNSAGR
jgi:hypothetical protein